MTLIDTDSATSILSLLFILLIHNGYSEVYTATEDIKDILQSEHYMADILENYIHIEKEKLNLLQRYVDTHKKDYEEASKDADSYAGNPLKAYLLIKRMSTELTNFEKLIQINTTEALIKNITTNRQNLKFPKEDDLEGTIESLIVMQQTYNLITSSMASGKLQGKQYNVKFNAASCFHIGRHSYRRKNLYYAYMWMKQAYKRFKKESDSAIGEGDILEYLAYLEYEQSDFEKSKKYLKKLLNLSPSYPKSFENKILVKELLKRNYETNVKLEPFKPITSENSEQSNKLCREEITNPLLNSSKLKCYYLNNNNPFLRIAPFKSEEIYDNPRIVMYHNIISNFAIQHIRNLTKSKLERANVVDKSGKQRRVDYRISKSAWLSDEEDLYIKRLNLRIRDMTGLSVESAENLQIVNYGVGGYYKAHFDFALNTEVKTENEKQNGNRLATVLLYLSNVKQGGCTAFPAIGVVVKPKKGAALFWYNLHSNGNRDYNTYHRACPVVMGSKWVANKWIHERGQEFFRPCDRVLKQSN